VRLERRGSGVEAGDGDSGAGLEDTGSWAETEDTGSGAEAEDTGFGAEADVCPRERPAREAEGIMSNKI
jgi:hypothetical protein